MNRVVIMPQVGIHEPRRSPRGASRAETGAGPGAGTPTSEIVVMMTTRAGS